MRKINLILTTVLIALLADLLYTLIFNLPADIARSPQKAFVLWMTAPAFIGVCSLWLYTYWEEGGPHAGKRPWLRIVSSMAFALSSGVLAWWDKKEGDDNVWIAFAAMIFCLLNAIVTIARLPLKKSK